MAEISIKDPFGAAIARTIITYRIYSVLEIGAFDGDGSTMVISQTLAAKRGRHVSLTSLEYNDHRFDNLVRKAAPFGFVTPVKMSSINRNSFTAWRFEEDVWNTEYNGLRYPKEQVRSWHSADCAFLRTISCGYLDCEADAGPWDAVLVDGGEFVGYDEFRLVRNRTKCLFLDDAYAAFKNNRACKELSSDKDWRIAWSSATVRNGAAIFVRRNLSKEPIFMQWRYKLAAYLKPA